MAASPGPCPVPVPLPGPRGLCGGRDGDRPDRGGERQHPGGQCQKRQLPLIASMGAGNKLDPARFEVADIYKTSVDPLARVMRKKLKEKGVKKLKVVYSKEEPRKIILPSDGQAEKKGSAGRTAPGSISFVPSVAGLIIASEVVKDLTGNFGNKQGAQK